MLYFRGKYQMGDGEEEIHPILLVNNSIETEKQPHLLSSLEAQQRKY